MNLIVKCVFFILYVFQFIDIHIFIRSSNYTGTFHKNEQTNYQDQA